MNFQQTYLYWLAGAVLLVVAIMSWRDKSNPRRLTTGLFWGLYGLVFLLGDWTYQLVGDKRTVNIAVGGVVVILAPSLAYCCLTICPHGRWRSSGRATTRR